MSRLAGPLLDPLLHLILFALVAYPAIVKAATDEPDELGVILLNIAYILALLAYACFLVAFRLWSRRR